MDVNVVVAVRCRPLSLKELTRNCRSILSGTKSSVHVQGLDSSRTDRDFSFDYCYFQDSTQGQVYNDLGSPAVLQALEGFNATIFAYGQTGSGKSHSMMGSSDDPGIIPRLSEDLWSKIQTSINEESLESKSDSAEVENSKFLVSVSFLEIYNEEIKDLFYRSDKNLKIRENAATGIFVEGLCELVVKTSDDMMRLLEQGNAFRRVAATNMNDQSSRSHSCFTIKIERKNVTQLSSGIRREHLRKAKLNLVDLAGSERAEKTGATGATLKEGIGINSSLTALGNVINALAEGGKRHIPYRESKLTRLLQESLGGNASTVMLATISPADYNYDETLSTLKYANRAKCIANTVTRNEDTTERVIRDLQGQIEALKQQLAAGEHSSVADQELQQRLRDMASEQQNAWEEKERLSKMLEEERQKNMNIVVGDMMEKVKEQKRERIRRINGLSVEKLALTKKYKEEKEKHGLRTKDINERSRTTHQVQKEHAALTALLEEAKKSGALIEVNLYEAKLEKVTNELVKSLNQIEAERTIWQHEREALELMRNRLVEISDQIIDDKAELVTFAGLLDQNERLRSQILEEERAKAKEVVKLELQAVRDKLLQQPESDIVSKEEEMASRLRNLESQLSVLKEKLVIEQEKNKTLNDELTEQWQYCSHLEQQLHSATFAQQQAVDEAAKAVAFLEEASNIHSVDKRIAELATLLEFTKQQQLEEIQRIEEQSRLQICRSLEEQRKSLEEEKYLIFQNLMDDFSRERSSLMMENQQFQYLLQQASKDIIYLTRRNEELSEMLIQSLLWEPK